MRMPRFLIFLSALLASALAFAHQGITDVSVTSVHQNGFAGLILDVRSPQEYAQGHIPGAINIPHTALPSHLASLGSIDQPVLVYCRSGRRAGIALQELEQLGYSALFHLDGDMLEWQTKNLPEVTTSSVN